MALSLAACLIHLQAQDRTATANDGTKDLFLAAAQAYSGAHEPYSGIHEPYIRVNAEDLRILVSKAQTIRRGDSRQNVESLLGKPTYDYRLLTKEKGRFIARLVKYYVARYDRDLVNEKLDKLVEFKFDADDRLTAVYSRFPGIPNQP